MAQGSESLLWCSWRKSRDARAGERVLREEPPGAQPPFPWEPGFSKGLVHTKELPAMPFSVTVCSAGKLPIPSHLAIYSLMKYRHIVPSSQASFWPWSYGEMIN